MDIAKIRKKLKETVPQDAEKQDTGREEESAGREDPYGTSAGPLPAGTDKEGAGKGRGLPPVPEGAADSLIELLTFVLAGEEYAFRIEDVYELIRLQRITRIPKAASSLLGITSLRGKVIPVVDLRKVLSLDGKGAEERKQKILILKGAKGPFGAVIDRVVGVISPSASGIVETPAHLPEAQMKFIEGVAIVDGRFISILRMEEVIAL